MGFGSSCFRVFPNGLAYFSSVFCVEFYSTLSYGGRSFLRSYLYSDDRFLVGLFYVRLYSTSLVVTIGSTMGAMVLAVVYGVGENGRVRAIPGVFPNFFLHDLHSFLRGERHDQERRYLGVL